MKSNVLTGLAASPGIYTGLVRKISELTPTPSSPLEVLVIKTASVEWLELIILARAIVTEVGGRTSHAATICRELGKPCVTAVPNVMTKLQNGSLVSVNGSTGEVVMLD